MGAIFVITKREVQEKYWVLLSLQDLLPNCLSLRYKVNNA